MSAKQPRDFMARAIELSEENVRSGRGGPFAAVVVNRGRVIAEGTNLVTSSNDPTAHAEIVAIRRACQVLGQFQLGGCEIYTSCEPCPMCFAAIWWARLDRLYFAASAEDAARVGFDDYRILQQLALPREQRQMPAEQLMRNEALGALREWMEKADKIPY
jgi:guanine deaminase